jgi:hypothetical protein
MALLPPYYNRELFSKHFLEVLLPKQPEWEAAHTQAAAALQALRELHRRVAPSATLREQQLEQKWIRPVLEALGVTFDVQVPLPTDNPAVTLAPDYALFGDPAGQSAARVAQEIGLKARYYYPATERREPAAGARTACARLSPLWADRRRDRARPAHRATAQPARPHRIADLADR